MNCGDVLVKAASRFLSGAFCAAQPARPHHDDDHNTLDREKSQIGGRTARLRQTSM